MEGVEVVEGGMMGDGDVRWRGRCESYNIVYI